MFANTVKNTVKEKRAKDAERDFESYRQQVRGLPETKLREEVARLRAQLAETRTEIERERRISGEKELEKEHFRAQMHRLVRLSLFLSLTYMEFSL